MNAQCLLSLAAAVSLAALHHTHSAPLREASLTRIINDVRIMEASGIQRSAVLSESVRDQQAVITGRQSRAELLFADKTLTRLGASTVFTFKEGTRNMDLLKGTMLLQVPKGAGGAQIKTAAVTAAITGTTLMVEYQPGSGQAEALVGPALSATPAPAPVPVSQGESAVASEITGSVKILVPGAAAFRPLAPGESIPAGSSLMTGANGSATVSPVPGTALRVLPNTTLRVQESQAASGTPRVRLDLREGGVVNIISRQNFRQVDYQVTTPQGVCAARGTVFAIFASGGRVLVLGAHGVAAFNGQPVGSGRAFGFGTGAGAPLAPGSPEFQNLLNQTLLALHQAAGRGMIPSDFLPQVARQLEQAGINLTTGQQQLLTPPPSSPVTAGSGDSPGRGFAKVVVIEGQVRVFITGKPGESMLLGPGQMIIFSPNTTRLPEPVDFDLQTLLKTSKLIQDMEENALIADNAGDLDNQEILLALKKQQDELRQQILDGTNLFILDGNEVVQLDEENILILQQLIDALGGILPGEEGGGGPIVFPPGTTGPLTTITGFPGLDATTTVATNPTITDPFNTVLATGKIMTGNPAEDGTTSPTEYLFGRPANAFDTAIGFDDVIEPTFSAFRFDSLSINGGFPIDTSASLAQRKLGLVAESGLDVNLATPLNLAALGPTGGLLLATVGGDISHLTGAVNLFGSDLIYYASNGNVHISNTGIFNGPGDFIAGASGTINYAGTATSLNDFSLYAGTTINFSGTVSSQFVDLSNALNLSPGSINLSGGSITASELNITATTLNLGTTSFGIIGPEINAYLNANQINLLADQSYGTNVHVFFSSQSDSINGNGHSLIGARGLAAIDSSVVDFDDLAIVGGDITVANGNLLVSGDLSALAAFNPGTGRITVTGGDIGDFYTHPSSITADGNITANNIYVGNLLQVNGPTSSITVSGEISFSGLLPSLLANGTIQASRINGILSNLAASSIILTAAESSLEAQNINTNFLDAADTFVSGSSISSLGGTPLSALIRAHGLSLGGGGINYSNSLPGGRGTNLTIELFSSFYLNVEEVGEVITSGGGGIGSNGGDGGTLYIKAPGIFLDPFIFDGISSNGGFASGPTFRGGHGGRVRLESTDDSGFQVFGMIEAVGGSGLLATGAHSGNGGTVELISYQSDIGIADAQILTGTSETDTPAVDKIGGTIHIIADGTEVYGGPGSDPNIGVTNSQLFATGDPQDSSISTRGGRITLQSLRNYVTPTAAIVINNSSELRAVTSATLASNMAITEIATGDTTFAKGNNAYIEIGDTSASATSLRADILRIQALNPNGGIRIYAGSNLDARHQLLLFAGSLTTSGSIDFLGAGIVNINSPEVLARAGTISVGANTMVQINSASNVGLYADNRLWTGATGPGGIQVNGPNAVPNTITVGASIGGATVNVNTRNAAGAPTPVNPPPPPPPPGI